MTQPALLVIDVQQGLDDPYFGQRNNPEAEGNIARLLAAWRAQARPVIHIQHNSVNPNSPLRPGLPGNAIKDEARPLPGEPHFTKSANSAFIGTNLEEHLHAQGITALVVVGLTTEHCVSTSVRMAANLGFAVTLVSDATAAFGKVASNGVCYSADEIHNVNLASLEGEFCAVRSTDAVLQEIA